MRHLVRETGLEGAIEIDSAGTAAYHTGEAPDPRSTACAARRGIVLGGQARQFVAEDFERFDYVLAMDESNQRAMAELASTPAARAKLFLARSFDPSAPAGASVPDPYYGGPSGFDDVVDMCEAACRGLLDHIRKEHDL